MTTYNYTHRILNTASKPLANTASNHLFYYPTPSNLNYNWNFGSLAGLFFALQIVTGIFLAAPETHVEWVSALFFGSTRTMRWKLSSPKPKAELTPLWGPLQLWSLLWGSAFVLFFAYKYRITVETLKFQAELAYLIRYRSRGPDFVEVFTWEVPSPILLHGFSMITWILLLGFYLSLSMLFRFGVTSTENTPVEAPKQKLTIMVMLRTKFVSSFPMSGPESVKVSHRLYYLLLGTTCIIFAFSITACCLLPTAFGIALLLLSPVHLIVWLFSPFYTYGDTLDAVLDVLHRELIDAIVNTLGSTFILIPGEFLIFVLVTGLICLCACFGYRDTGKPPYPWGF